MSIAYIVVVLLRLIVNTMR